MAILDIQIVSASLAEIQAGLSASADEISWVQTSYLIAEVIMIPLSGTLSRVLSTRWMFVISAGGFTLMSLMCATATSIERDDRLARAAGLHRRRHDPDGVRVRLHDLPACRSARSSRRSSASWRRSRRPSARRVGGYLTDLFSWHWLFLVNIVPGIFVTVVDLSAGRFRRAGFQPVQDLRLGGPRLHGGVPRQRSNIVLEEGPTNDWFAGRGGARPAIACVVGGIGVLLSRVHGQAADRRPARFHRPQFRRGLAPSASCMGIGLYGLTYLYPVYLAPRARLFVAADRRDDVRHRRLHVPHGAGRRHPVAQARSARDDGDRLRCLRDRHLA